MWCLVKGLGGLHVEHLKGGLAGGYWEVLDILSWNKNIWLTNVGKYGLKANGEAKVVNRKNVQLSFLECETYHSNGIFTISRYIHCTSFLLEQFSFQPVLLPWHPKESNFQSGLSLEALPLLWKAERCGLHGQHWIVDALRALAAEDLGFLCVFLVLFTGSDSLWF